MLEHQKYVLQNVSTDKRLFKKELLKSLKWLNEVESAIFMDWVKEEFMETHHEIISEVFEETLV